MKRKEMTTSIGVINLAEMELGIDGIEVFIPIISVSKKLKNAIMESIEVAKKEFQTEFLELRNMKWSDKGINIDYQGLHAIITETRVLYEVCVDFTDKENAVLETGVKIEVDLSEYTSELKKLILKALIDKFM